MWPLVAFSLASVAIIIERIFWGPRKERVIPASLQRDVLESASRGRAEEIIGLCRSDNSPLARMVLVIAKNIEKPRMLIVEATQRAGRKEIVRMQRFLPTLGTIAAAAPLLGLLGTVSGMITTFQTLNVQGLGNASGLSGGIAEALITTATGLGIAIPSLIFHRAYMARIREYVVELESISSEVLDELLDFNAEDEQTTSSVRLV